jgi:hypothetical protein
VLETRFPAASESFSNKLSLHDGKSDEDDDEEEGESGVELGAVYSEHIELGILSYEKSVGENIHIIIYRIATDGHVHVLCLQSYVLVSFCLFIH